jgi:hypothetical protein
MRLARVTARTRMGKKAKRRFQATRVARFGPLWLR